MSERTQKELMDERLAKLTPQQRELLQRKLAGGAAKQPTIPEAIAALGPFECGVPYPQSPAQQRIWFYERLQSGTAAYHMYDNYRLMGPIDVPAMQAAFEAAVARQASLRTGFYELAGKPVQSVAPHAAITLRLVDLSSLGDDKRESAADQFVTDESARPFDLAAPPLMRATLVRLAPEEHLLIMVVHHIVADAWSLDVLTGEVKRFYNARIDSVPAVQPPLALQFPDIARWQTSAPQQQRIERQLGFWKQALAGVTGVLDLPTDRARSATLSAAGASYNFVLPAGLTKRLNDLARAENATLFMAMLAAFQTLLGRWSGQDDVVVGTPLANRGTAEFGPLVGLFVNTLPLRGDLSGDPSLRTLLARTRSHFVDALGNADAPLERIVDALRLERVPGRTALFQAMFVQQAAQVENADGFRGVQWKPRDIGVSTSRFELTLAVSECAKGMDAVIDYSTALFDRITIARMAEQLQSLIEAMLDAPDTPVAQLDMLADVQKRELLALGDGGPAPAGASTEQCIMMQNVVAEDRADLGLSVVILKTADRKAEIMRVLAPLSRRSARPMRSPSPHPASPSVTAHW